MFRNMTVGMRLGLGFSIAVCFLIASALAGIFSLRANNAAIDTIYNDRVVPLKQLKIIADVYAVNVIDAVNKAHAGLIDAEVVLKTLEEGNQQIKKEWDAYMATKLTVEEEKLAREAIVLFGPANQDILRLASELRGKSGRISGQLVKFDGPMYASIDPISSKIGELIDLQLRVAKSDYEAAEKRYASMLWELGILVVLSIVVCTLASFMITRSMLRELGGEPELVAEIARRVAEGDLTIVVETREKDKSSVLFAMKVMVERLSKIIAEVRGGADALSSASEEVSATAQSMSQGSAEQAAGIEQTSASVEQITASITQNTENAKVTDGMANKAAKEAAEGGVAVTQTVEAMKQISKRISIIDDIAYQTNLLALNAAIEAARAGEHGKGFAVVAAEVRKLAERSQIAAQEISELSGNSVGMAEKAGKLLDEMVPSIAKTSDLVQEISAASEEQSSSIRQMNSAMTQLNQTAQQNASSSEELAATAEELSAQAEQLQQAVAFFRLEDIALGTATARKASARRKTAIEHVAEKAAPVFAKTVTAVHAGPEFVKM